MTLFVNIVITLALAYWRVFVFPEGWRPDILKTVAHLYIAGLFVYGWLEQELWDLRWCVRQTQDDELFVMTRLLPPRRPSYHFILAILLTIVEIIAFGRSRGFF